MSSRGEEREADVGHWHLCRFVRRGPRARYFDWGGTADKLKAGKSSTKSDADRPVILGTVPNPKYPKVKKVDALTWTMKVQEPKKKRTGKLGATRPTAKTKKSEGDKLGPRNLSH